MSKLKIGLFIVLVLALVVTPILSGCTGEKIPEPTKEEPLVLRFVHFLPAGSPMDEDRIALGKLIEEKTEGRVVVEVYAGGTLCESADIADAVRTGVAQLGEVNPGYTPGLFPMASLTEVPGFYRGAVVTTKVVNELMPEYLGVECKASGIECLWCSVLASAGHVFSTEPLRTVADFEGVTIGVGSDVWSQHCESLGFVPSLIPGNEQFLAFDKGVVDAVSADFQSSQMSHFYEVANYCTILDLWGLMTCFIGMNSETYDALPSDIREIIVDEIRKFSDEMVVQQAAKEEAARQFHVEQGIEIITLSEEDYELAQQLLSGADEWIAAQEKAGVKDARAYAEAFMELLDKYAPE